MHLCLFEDGREQLLAPLTLTRPVFELVCGRYTLRERLIRAWNITEWGVILRPHLSGVYREEHPEARLNDPGWLFESPVLLVNGRWIPEDVSTIPCDPKEAVLADEQPVALWVLPDEWKLYGHLDQTAFLKLVTSTRTIVDTPGTLLTRPWDVVEANAAQLRRDYQLTTLYPQPIRRKGLEVLGDERNLSVAPRTEFEPFVVLDARRGPITIDDGVKIQAFSRIEGPCHLGRESQVEGGRVGTGTTIGPACSVAGTIERSIVHSHVTKSHLSDLKHSYVCPWVNFGTGSATLTHQPDRTPVNVPCGDEPIETGLHEVGSFIGDFVSASANVLLGPGSSIGPLAMIFSDGLAVPRQIPAFSRYRDGQLDRNWPLEELFEIARAAMSAREMELTAAREMLFRLLFDLQQQPQEFTARKDDERNWSVSEDRSAA